MWWLPGLLIIVGSVVAAVYLSATRRPSGYDLLGNMPECICAGFGILIGVTVLFFSLLYVHSSAAVVHG